MALTMQAATLTVQSGGVAINSYDFTATGNLANPWLINEDMTGLGVLNFAGTPGAGGSLGTDNPTGSGHSRGKWISKTVTNNTNTSWTSFELELEVILGTPSGEGDGLSFADGSSLINSFASDKFSAYTRIDTARDYLNFHGGTVDPGQAVSFMFVITDNVGNDPFYLSQTPNKSEAPEPSTMSFMLLGAGGLMAPRLRKLLSR
jgi:hypothetical protein